MFLDPQYLKWLTIQTFPSTNPWAWSKPARWSVTKTALRWFRLSELRPLHPCKDAQLRRILCPWVVWVGFIYTVMSFRICSKTAALSSCTISPAGLFWQFWMGGTPGHFSKRTLSIVPSGTCHNTKQKKQLVLGSYWGWLFENDNRVKMKCHAGSHWRSS